MSDTGTKRGGEPSSSQNTKRPRMMAETRPETGQKENQTSIITDPQNSKKKKKSKLPEMILDIFEEIGTEGSGPKLFEALTTIESQRIESISSTERAEKVAIASVCGVKRRPGLTQSDNPVQAKLAMKKGKMGK